MEKVGLRGQQMFMLGLLLMVLGGCDSGIPIVGIDDKGASRFFLLTDEKYADQLGLLSTQMHSAVEKGMADKKTKNGENSWAIHTISVGVGVIAQLDTAPLWLSVEPRVRFIFSDREMPSIPATP